MNRDRDSSEENAKKTILEIYDTFRPAEKRLRKFDECSGAQAGEDRCALSASGFA
jgi:hypothetical protein